MWLFGFVAVLYIVMESYLSERERERERERGGGGGGGCSGCLVVFYLNVKMMLIY